MKVRNIGSNDILRKFLINYETENKKYQWKKDSFKRWISLDFKITNQKEITGFWNKNWKDFS